MKVSAIRRHVDKFEFYSVRIAEEDGVVAFTIRRIIGWWIKHCCPDLEQQLVEKVNIFAAVGMPARGPRKFHHARAPLEDLGSLPGCEQAAHGFAHRIGCPCGDEIRDAMPLARRQ